MCKERSAEHQAGIELTTDLRKLRLANKNLTDQLDEERQRVAEISSSDHICRLQTEITRLEMGPDWQEMYRIHRDRATDRAKTEAIRSEATMHSDMNKKLMADSRMLMDHNRGLMADVTAARDERDSLKDKFGKLQVTLADSRCAASTGIDKLHLRVSDLLVEREKLRKERDTERAKLDAMSDQRAELRDMTAQRNEMCNSLASSCASLSDMRLDLKKAQAALGKKMIHHMHLPTDAVEPEVVEPEPRRWDTHMKRIDDIEAEIAKLNKQEQAVRFSTFVRFRDAIVTTTEAMKHRLAIVEKRLDGIQNVARFD